MAAGGRAAHAHEQPRPRGGRAPAGPRRLRRHRQGRAQLGLLRRDRALAARAGERRDAARPVGQAGRRLPHAPGGAARPDLELHARAGLGDLGALLRARPQGPDDVRPDDGGLLDLHRDPGHPAGHLRDLRGGRPAALRRQPEGPARPHRRPRRHGRRPAARGHDERGRDDRGRGGPPPHRAAPRDALPRRHGGEPGRGPHSGARRDRRRAGALDRPPRQRRRRPARARAARRRARPGDRPDERPRPAQRLRAQPLELRRRRSRCGRADPARYMAEARRSMGEHVQAMLDLQGPGSVVFDYGNNIRAEAAKAGVAERLRLPRLRARLHPAALLRGQGPVPLGLPLRRPRRPRGHRRGRPRDLPRGPRPRPLDPPRPRAGEAPGAPVAHLLARLRRARRRWASSSTSSCAAAA